MAFRLLCTKAWWGRKRRRRAYLHPLLMLFQLKAQSLGLHGSKFRLLLFLLQLYCDVTHHSLNWRPQLEPPPGLPQLIHSTPTLDVALTLELGVS